MTDSSGNSNPDESQSWIGPIFDGKGKGFIDWNGKWVFQIDCDDLGEFQEGLAPFLREGKIGFINASGAEVIKPAFGTHAIVLPPFREGLAPVRSGEEAVYINTSGEIVFSLGDHAVLWNFMEGKALTSTSERGFAVIDRDGEVISILPFRDIPFHFNFPEDWNCFPCIAGDDGDGNQAYINWKGEFIFPPLYTYVGPFVNGLGPFSPDGHRYGLVRINGEIILLPQFPHLYSFSEGLAAAALERNKWGFLDTTGQWLIEPKFRQALPFSEGLACVTVPGNDRRGSKGFIDHSGDFVIEPRYYRQASFNRGWVLVEFEGRIQILDKKGRVIWERPLLPGE